MASEPPKEGWELTFAFPDQSPSYAHGFVCGKLWQRMKESNAPIQDTVENDIVEHVVAMAMALGWTESVERLNDDWSHVILEKRLA